jgi:hypothetical protein
MKRYVKTGSLEPKPPSQELKDVSDEELLSRLSTANKRVTDRILAELARRLTPRR